MKISNLHHFDIIKLIIHVEKYEQWNIACEELKFLQTFTLAFNLTMVFVVVFQCILEISNFCKIDDNCKGESI